MGNKFTAGALFMTRGINDRGAQDVKFAEFVESSLTKHLSCDWGDLCEVDRLENEKALIDGGRLFSVYGSGFDKIWIITEADGSATTVLLPDEY